MNFQSDTKDKTEQLYLADVLRNFPKYSDFWNKFIGVKISKNGALLPYGLTFPTGMSLTQKKDLNNSYRKISMYHYSLFCHLAGTHYHLELLKKTPITSSKKSYFRHFEELELCYIHLGVVQNQFANLWKILFNFIGIRERYFSAKMLNYLTPKRKKYLWNNLQSLHRNSIRFRNNIVHFSRGASRIAFNKSYISEIIKRNINWDNQLNYKDWIESSIKIQNDLTDWEIIINKLHDLLINELDTYFGSIGVSIKY